MNLSSAGHRFSDVDLVDPDFEHTPYDPWVAYGRSKTANVLFAVELDRRGREPGRAPPRVHPGGIMTELGRHLDRRDAIQLIAARRAAPNVWKSVPQGAATQVWCGFVAAGRRDRRQVLRGLPRRRAHRRPGRSSGVIGYALDPESAAALWARSEELVGETFPT